MTTITSKSEINLINAACLNVLQKQSWVDFIDAIDRQILKQKIRYPLLEYVAVTLYQNIPKEKQIEFLEKIVALEKNGSEVIAGKILQLRLNDHYQQSIDRSIRFITDGANWLSCDIIAERVLGEALLQFPEKTLPVLTTLGRDSDKWKVRAVGVAIHYAVKKGIHRSFAEALFHLLLSCSGTSDFHTKKGIGWAAKTLAKFYPDIIKMNEEKIFNDKMVRQWFRTKVNIGLSRSFKYAHKYSG